MQISRKQENFDFSWRLKQKRQNPLTVRRFSRNLFAKKFSWKYVNGFVLAGNVDYFWAKFKLSHNNRQKFAKTAKVVRFSRKRQCFNGFSEKQPSRKHNLGKFVFPSWTNLCKISHFHYNPCTIPVVLSCNIINKNPIVLQHDNHSIQRIRRSASQ